MNTNVMEGKWEKIRGELQKQWGKLTNDDLDQIQGEISTLEGKLRERYGYSKDEAKDQVDKFMREARDQFAEVQGTLTQRLRNTGEELQHRASEAREKVRDTAGNVEAKLKEVEMQDVAETVKSNPLIVAGIALLLTVFVGMWLKSMKS